MDLYIQFANIRGRKRYRFFSASTFHVWIDLKEDTGKPSKNFSKEIFVVNEIAVYLHSFLKKRYKA